MPMRPLMTMLTHLAFRPPLAGARDVGCKARRARSARFEGHSLIPPPTPQLRDFRTCAASPLGVQKSLHCGVTNRQRLRRCLMPQWVSTLQPLSAARLRYSDNRQRHRRCLTSRKPVPILVNGGVRDRRRQSESIPSGMGRSAILVQPSGTAERAARGDKTRTTEGRGPSVV